MKKEKVSLMINVSEIIPLILGLLLFFYWLSPIRFWEKFVFPNQIEIIVFTAFTAVIILGFLILKVIVSFSTLKLRVSNIDIILLVSAIYVGCYCLLQYQTINPEYLFESFALIVMYLFFRAIKLKLHAYFLLILPVAAILQILYGIQEQTYYFRPGYGFSDIRGIFYNTGIFGGFIAIAAVVTLGLIDSSSTSTISGLKRTILKIGKAFLVLAFVFFLLQLIFGRSRAAWVSCLAGILYLIGSRDGLRSKFLNLSRFKKWSLVLIFLFTIITIFYGLYRLKTASADGRVLIWKVSFDMIKDKPLFGHGLGGFQANYMEYQAAYFKNQPESPYSYLADDNNFAFNELLKIWVEQGVVGLLLAVILLYLLFFGNKGERNESNKSLIIIIVRASLLSLLVFGLFSYPMEIFQFKVVFVFFVAFVSKYSPAINTIRIGKLRYPMKTEITDHFTFKIGLIAAWLATALILIPSIRDYAYACKKWNAVLSGFSEPNYSKSIETLETIYPELKDDWIFLTTYGKVLNIAGRYESAIPVLQRANSHFSLASNYIELGKSYKATSNFENAKNVWTKASYMIPSMFTPKYLLAKMLYETGKTADSRKIAAELLRKEVKIRSPGLPDMLKDMTSIVGNTNK